MIEILSALAVWRLSHMIQSEDGPYEIFDKLRSAFIHGGDAEYGVAKNEIGKGLMCFYCLSIWIAMPFAAFLSWHNIFMLPIYVLALSAAAIFINIVSEILQKFNQEKP